MRELVNNASLTGDLGELQITRSSAAVVALNQVWFNKTASTDQWDDGPLTYTMQVRNEGDPNATPDPDPDLTEIVITDTIDAATARLIESSVTFTPEGAGTLRSYTPGTGDLIIDLEPIAPLATVTITFQVEKVF